MTSSFLTGGLYGILDRQYCWPFIVHRFVRQIPFLGDGVIVGISPNSHIETIRSYSVSRLLIFDSLQFKNLEA